MIEKNEREREREEKIDDTDHSNIIIIFTYKIIITHWQQLRKKECHYIYHLFYFYFSLV